MTEKVNPEAKFFNAFNLIPGMGPIAFKNLLGYFNNLEQAWAASPASFSRAGLTKSIISQIGKARQHLDPDKELTKLTNHGITIITINDSAYPAALKQIYNPPALLYARGKITKQDKNSIAIVGTRKLTDYGQQITPGLTMDLVNAGLTIVSGLAKGIDTLAHKAALEAGGRTIAVLGSGIDDYSIYPRENLTLAKDIMAQGAVISEFPMGTQPLAQNFPQRNRIVAGLSLGVLVIEAPEKSGALITARDALEQNREVFACPGHIMSANSVGPNSLIKMGAKLVSQATDILEELNLDYALKTNELRISAGSEEEKLILDCMSEEPMTVDKIISITKLSTPVVNSCLSMMELYGKIKSIGSNKYIKAK